MMEADHQERTADEDSANEMVQGGPTGSPKRRRRFTNCNRLSIVRNVNRRLAAGQTIRAACRELGIIPKQYREWKKKSQDMSKCRPAAMSICKGHDGILKPIEEQLLRFVFELREQGMTVSHPMIAVKAAALCRPFREKSRNARLLIVGRWKKHHGLTYRMGTNESQRAPSETKAEAEDFMNIVRPIVSEANRHQDYIINMDQTPVWFSFNAKRTLDLIGKKTIHVRKSTNDTKRATFAMTITASGKILTPYMVFKGKAGARIETREAMTFPRDMYYACQENAWMDERVMLLWVEKVLKPYVEQAPDGIVPLIFLDKYRCHMMRSVVEQIQELGVEVQHIPGGCTALVQPVDVGANKPFKNRVRDRWESWMIADGLLSGTTTPPTRQLIAEWCSDCFKTLDAQMIRNAWRHHNYTYFPPTAPTQQQAQQFAILEEV